MVFMEKQTVREGLFPVEKVQLLIGKPDAVDIVAQNKRRSGLPAGANQYFQSKGGSSIAPNQGRSLPTPTPRRATVVGGPQEPRPEPKKEVLLAISPDGTYDFMDWAQSNFREYGSGGSAVALNKSTSGGPRRTRKGRSGTITKEQMIEFSPEPIEESLNKNDSINKMAVESFLSIMKFMDDFPKGKAEKFTLSEELVQRGIEELLLRDEIYCQLMKQTTRHPKKENRRKGLRLLSICLSCFAPSPEFTPYVNTWLYGLNSDSELEIPLIAQDCQTRLEQTCKFGDRFWACSRDEMTSIVNASPIVLKAEMLDGNIKTVTIESHTNAQQAAAILINKLNLPDSSFEGWGLWERYGDDVYPLAESQNVCDVKSSWKMINNKHSKNAKLLKDIYHGDKTKFSLSGSLPDGNRTGEAGGFVFKKKIWLPIEDTPPDDLIQNNPATSNLLYRQIIDDFLNSRVVFDLKTTLQFSAYHVAAILGGVKDLNSNNYHEFLPRHIKQTKKASEWISKLSENVNYEIGGVTGKQAQRALMNKWQTEENGGGCGFLVYQKDRPEISNRMWLMISSDSVRLYQTGTTELVLKWTYNNISQWSLTEDGWTMITGDLFKPERYSFSSPWAISIYDLYVIYLNASDTRKRA